MTDTSLAARQQIEELLKSPDQSWLLGAGISCDAGIPLMFPLTERVHTLLKDDGGSPYPELFEKIHGELPDGSHVEHVLSHLGDYIALAERSREKKVVISGDHVELNQLTFLHTRIRDHIRNTIRWGYRAANDGNQAIVGSQKDPIVSVTQHCDFVRALFRHRRANLERRPPIRFFTTNYDTLLEDALALERIPYHDGFCGGAMAFWEPAGQAFGANVDANVPHIQARVHKLHGSIDWYANEKDVVVRRRDGARYPPEDADRVLIYPQATKYQLTQLDPFAALFAQFRAALNSQGQSLLAICGYSFGDDHINQEIERALRQRNNRLTLLVFAYQPDGKLPAKNHNLPQCLVKWLSDDGLEPAQRQRIVVAGRRGVYHGSLENRCPAHASHPHEWWSFSGVTKVLKHGAAK